MAEGEAESRVAQEEVGAISNGNNRESLYMRIYSNSWFQVILISFICFCCPGVRFFNFLQVHE